MNKLKHHPHKTRETSKLTKEIHRTIEIILKCIPIQSKFSFRNKREEKKILFPVSIRGVFEKSTARIHTNKIVHLKHIKKNYHIQFCLKTKLTMRTSEKKNFFSKKHQVIIAMSFFLLLIYLFVELQHDFFDIPSYFFFSFFP